MNGLRCFDSLVAIFMFSSGYYFFDKPQLDFQSTGRFPWRVFMNSRRFVTRQGIFVSKTIRQKQSSLIKSEKKLLINFIEGGANQPGLDRYIHIYDFSGLATKPG